MRQAQQKKVLKKINKVNRLIQIMLTVIMALAFGFHKGNINKPTPQQSATSDIPTVDFCQLTHKHNGKVVRVRALYRNDFEESSLSSPNCHVPYLTWVEFDSSYESCTKKKVLKKINKVNRLNGGPSVDVVFVGRYETGGDGTGGYGHLDMYLTQFVVMCVEDVKPLGSFRPLPDEKK